MPSGFWGAHRTPQTSPALMTFIPCAPAPGRPGHPSRHLGKTLRGLEGEWQRDGRTWFREPAPAWTCLGLAPSACPKGAKGKGAREGAGQAQAERAPRPLLLFKLGAAPTLRGLTRTWEARRPCALRPSEPRACLASAKRTRCVTAHRTRGDMRGVRWLFSRRACHSLASPLGYKHPEVKGAAPASACPRLSPKATTGMVCPCESSAVPSDNRGGHKNTDSVSDLRGGIIGRARAESFRFPRKLLAKPLWVPGKADREPSRSAQGCLDLWTLCLVPGPRVTQATCPAEPQLILHPSSADQTA